MNSDASAIWHDNPVLFVVCHAARNPDVVDAATERWDPVLVSAAFERRTRVLLLGAAAQVLNSDHDGQLARLLQAGVEAIYIEADCLAEDGLAEDGLAEDRVEAALSSIDATHRLSPVYQLLSRSEIARLLAEHPVVITL